MAGCPRRLAGAHDQRRAQAPAATRFVHGERTQEHRGRVADADWPQPHATDDLAALTGYETEARQGPIALPQALGRLRIAPWPERALDQSVDFRRIGERLRDERRQRGEGCEGHAFSRRGGAR